MGSYLRSFDDVQFEPIEQWPGEETEWPRRSQFKASYSQTLEVLDRELVALDASAIVLQVYLDRRHIRNDGLPRAQANPGSPGVILSFDSAYGPLSYPCDAFDHWHDNLRAIALALEALRKVDRYGVTKRAEQYKGWQQLPHYAATTVNGAPRNVSEAMQLLQGLVPDMDCVATAGNVEVAKKVLREAQQKTHPDRGGSQEMFKKVMEAERLLIEEFQGAW